MNHATYFLFVVRAIIESREKLNHAVVSSEDRETEHGKLINCKLSVHDR